MFFSDNILTKFGTHVAHSCLKVNNCNDPKFSDRKVWANSADPDQTAPKGAVCVISVFTVCYSIHIFLMKYPRVWPLCLNFR